MFSSQNKPSRAPAAVMLAISATLVVVIALMSYQNARDRSIATEQANISQEIQDATTGLLSALKDAETGQRGYLLTDSNEYLEPYNNAVVVIPALLGRLQAASRFRSDQAERVADLTVFVKQKMQELAATIELRRTIGQPAALARMRDNQGRELMDEIRQRTTRIREVTLQRVAEYSARAETNADRLAYVSTFGCLLLLGFLGLSAITIFRGFAQREALHREAAANAESLRVTISSIGDGVVATDANGNVTLMNPVAQQLTGWSEKNAAGKPIREVFCIVNETTRAVVENPAEKTLLTGAIVGLANHTILLSKDGREIPIDDSGAPIRDIQGKVFGAILVFRDISERRKTERLLRESNEQLQEFVTVAAHDLRSPLNSVSALAELLASQFNQNSPPQAPELVGHITQSTARMSRLLEDLLAYSRASHFDHQEATLVALDDVLSTVLDNLRSAIESNNALVTSQPLPSVIAQESHMLQLLQNLLGNAIKYRGQEPPRVSISATKNHNEWIVSVADNGMGIDPRHVPKIFKPFKRLHGDDLPGSGIGLATCSKIVAGYGGKIWVESQPGNGSTFFFSLPLRKELFV